MCRRASSAVGAGEVRTLDEHDLASGPEVVRELGQDGIGIETLTEGRIGVRREQIGDGTLDLTTAIHEAERSLAMQNGCVGSLLVGVGDHAASEVAVLEGLTQLAEYCAVGQ